MESSVTVLVDLHVRSVQSLESKVEGLLLTNYREAKPFADGFRGLGFSGIAIGFAIVNTPMLSLYAVGLQQPELSPTLHLRCGRLHIGPCSFEVLSPKP